MKQRHLCPRTDLKSSIPFPTMITIILSIPNFVDKFTKIDSDWNIFIWNRKRLDYCTSWKYHGIFVAIVSDISCIITHTIIIIPGIIITIILYLLFAILIIIATIIIIKTVTVIIISIFIISYRLCQHLLIQFIFFSFFFQSSDFSFCHFIKTFIFI